MSVVDASSTNPTVSPTALKVFAVKGEVEVPTLVDIAFVLFAPGQVSLCETMLIRAGVVPKSCDITIASLFALSPLVNVPVSDVMFVDAPPPPTQVPFTAKQPA